MPIYEFVCSKCGQEFEELILGSEEKVICPKCGSNQVTKLMSACKFKTGGPIVMGSGTSNSSGGSSSGCAGCSGGNCSTCGG